MDRATVAERDRGPMIKRSKLEVVPLHALYLQVMFWEQLSVSFSSPEEVHKPSYTRKREVQCTFTAGRVWGVSVEHTVMLSTTLHGG